MTNSFNSVGTPEYSQFIHLSRYSRWLEEEGRRETWDETTYRYVDFFAKRFPDLKDEILPLQDFILNFKTMPSMRCLMTAGKALEKTEVAGYNCSFVSIDNQRAFDEIMYILMAGVGVGFSVERQYINKLPEVAESFYKSDTTIVVPDSKIGWATSFRELISLLYAGKIPNWDLSRLRPAGARLKTFGGRSSGPVPLDNLFKFTVNLFRKAAGRRLNSLECHDLACKIGDVVVVGGVRRSALISLSNVSDDRMRTAKSGQWWLENPQRRLANNSACYTEKPELEVFMKEWQALYESKSGERGIFNRVSALKQVMKNDRRSLGYDMGCNPSLRKGTKVWTTEGVIPIEQLEGNDFYVRNLNGEISKAKCWLSGKNQPLYKLTLQGGHEYYATAEHEWPIWDGKNKKWVKVKTPDIVGGSHLPIIKADKLTDGKEGSYDDGFGIGWNLGDGWITERQDTGKIQIGFMVSDNDRKHGIHLKIQRWLEDSCDFSGSIENKTEINCNNEKLRLKFAQMKVVHKSKGLPRSVWKEASETFRKGLIDGLFSSDGCVTDRIQLTSVNKSLIKDVSELLGFYGIRNTIKEADIAGVFPNGKDYGKTYHRYDLCIKHQESLRQFVKLFKLTHAEKQSKLEALIRNTRANTKGRVRVLSVEKTSLKEDVWDISVADQTHCFQLAHCITGNCSEIILRSCQLCNLSEIIARSDDTLESLKEKAKVAAIFGTLQSTLTDFKYLRKVWSNNTTEERLLGVSITGIMDHKTLSNADNSHLKRWLEEIKQVCIDTNKEWAEKLGIEPSVAITCVKPSGCRPCNGLVTTNSGIFTLKDFMQDHSSMDNWHTIENGPVALGAGPVTKSFINGESPILSVNMSFGMEVESTPNHKWFVKERGWVRADELKVGDQLDIQCGTYKSKNECALLPLNHDVNSLAMSPDLAWMLGYMWGNGARIANKLRWADKNDDNLIKAQRILIEQLGVKSNITNKALEVDSEDLWSWLNNNSVWKYYHSNFNVIPLVVRKSSQESVIAFLGGIIDSDGWASDQELTYTTYDSEFSKHIQHIGWTVGIALDRSRDANKEILSLLGNTDNDALNLFVKHCNKAKDILKAFNSQRVLRSGVVKSVEPAGVAPTFDVETLEHWFFAGAVRSHNTVSQLCNTASGIHARYADYYIRRVRIDKKDPIGEFMKEKGFPWEVDVMNPENLVFSFPVKAPQASVKVNDMDALKQLEIWKVYQDYWCEHKPSCTVYYNDDNFMAVGSWVWQNFDDVSGISFLPYSDHIYDQAPYESIDEETYQSLLDEMPKDVNWAELGDFEKEDNTAGSQTYACSGGSCEIVDLVEE